MKKKDQLTPFLARELLFDYAKGILDEERALAVKKALESHSELRLQLRGLQEKLEVLSTFDKTRPSESWINELSLPHPSLAQQIVSFEQRLAPKFWKALPLAILSMAVIFAVVLFKPWKLVKFNEVEVAKVHLNDDEVRMEAALALSEKDIEGVMKAQTAEENEAAEEEVEESGVQMVDATNQKKEPISSRKEPKEEDPPKVGELYRGFMTVDNLQVVTKDTVDKIVELGGRKAGQVQLGWERDEEERYFHFSLPEKNKQVLLDFLSNFGQVRLSSQEHPLVMPEGKIRIILVVKQNPEVQNPPPGSNEEESSESEEEDEAT